MNLFKYDSPIVKVLNRICDFLILSVLWVLCSLPVFTLGTSTTALYYCMLKINREKDSSVIKMFFKSFRENLKQGSVLTIIFILSGVFLYVDIQASKVVEGIVGNIIEVILVIMLIVWGVMLSYVFPILAQFDNTVINILRNSFLLSILNLGKTLLVLVINTIPVVLFLKLPYLFMYCLPMLLSFGIALIAFINSKILIVVFDKYIEET